MSMMVKSSLTCKPSSQFPRRQTFKCAFEKRNKESGESRQTSRDFTKYDVTIGGKQFPSLNKRKMMYRLVAEVFASGGTPEQVKEACLQTN